MLNKAISRTEERLDIIKSVLKNNGMYRDDLLHEASKVAGVGIQTMAKVLQYGLRCGEFIYNSSVGKYEVNKDEKTD